MNKKLIKYIFAGILGYLVLSTIILGSIKLLSFTDLQIDCNIHLIFIPISIVFAFFVAIWWGVLKHRTYFLLTKNNEVKDIDWIAVIYCSIFLCVCILQTILGNCTFCNVFMIVGWVEFAVALTLFSLFIFIKPKESVVTNVENNISKQSIFVYLQKYGKEVLSTNRPNITRPGRGMTEGLPLADTHYVVLGKKIKNCFAYVYEDTNGNVRLLVKTCPEHFKDIQKTHNNVNESTFPKVHHGNIFYSIPVDNTYTANDVFEILDVAIDVAKGNAYNRVISSTKEELSLKESLAVVSANGSNHITSKKMIIEHLITYGKKLDLNNRPNMTNPGRGKTEGLPLADTHYIVNGKSKICFAYIYENSDGNVLMLVKTSKEHFDYIKRVHINSAKSNFPKVSNGNKFYSIPVDDTFNEKMVNELLDEVIKVNSPVDEIKKVELKPRTTPKPKVAKPVAVNPKPLK